MCNGKPLLGRDALVVDGIQPYDALDLSLSLLSLPISVSLQVF